MVTDRQTDTVYFSEWALKDFPVPINNICKLLDKYGIKYGFLRNTKDYSKSVIRNFYKQNVR